LRPLHAKRVVPLNTSIVRNDCARNKRHSRYALPHPIILGNTKRRRTNQSKTSRKVRRDREDVQLKENEDENHERPVALALEGLEQIRSRHGFTRLRLRGPKIFDLYACLNLHSHTKVPVSASDCCHAESGFVGLIASRQDTGLE